MKRLHALRHRLVAGAAALALAAAWTAGARADVAYAFAESQVTNLNISVTGATLAAGTGTFLTQTGANLTGFPASGSPGTYDAPQALINAASAEDNFSKLATFATSPATAGTLPTAPSTSFAHGDVAFTGTPPVSALFGAGVTVNSVAESYLNTSSGTSLATGEGGWTITSTFTISGAAAPVALNFGYGFANDIYAATSSSAGNTASAQSNFSFSYSIKETGNTDDGPIALSGNFGAPPNNQGEQIRGPLTGLNYSSPFTLGNGTYTITLTGSSESFVSIEAVPEPGPLALAAIAGSLVGFAGLKRKFGRKVQA